ncbi:unnamed protein product, partial [Amoebophrya sp. A120]|eukprot:GSA120T00008286001.1
MDSTTTAGAPSQLMSAATAAPLFVLQLQENDQNKTQGLRRSDDYNSDNGPRPGASSSTRTSDTSTTVAFRTYSRSIFEQIHTVVEQMVQAGISLLFFSFFVNHLELPFVLRHHPVGDQVLKYAQRLSFVWNLAIGIGLAQVKKNPNLLLPTSWVFCRLYLIVALFFALGTNLRRLQIYLFMSIANLSKWFLVQYEKRTGTRVVDVRIPNFEEQFFDEEDVAASDLLFEEEVVETGFTRNPLYPTSKEAVSQSLQQPLLSLSKPYDAGRIFEDVASKRSMVQGEQEPRPEGVPHEILRPRGAGRSIAAPSSVAPAAAQGELPGIMSSTTNTSSDQLVLVPTFAGEHRPGLSRDPRVRGSGEVVDRDTTTRDRIFIDPSRNTNNYNKNKWATSTSSCSSEGAPAEAEPPLVPNEDRNIRNSFGDRDHDTTLRSTSSSLVLQRGPSLSSSRLTDPVVVGENDMMSSAVTVVVENNSEDGLFTAPEPTSATGGPPRRSTTVKNLTHDRDSK